MDHVPNTLYLITNLLYMAVKVTRGERERESERERERERERWTFITAFPVHVLTQIDISYMCHRTHADTRAYTHGTVQDVVQRVRVLDGSQKSIR